MKRFLGLSEDEIKENEKLWREENGSNLQSAPDAQSQLRSAGITPGGMAADFGDQDAEASPDMAAMAEPGAEGMEGEGAPAEAPIQ